MLLAPGYVVDEMPELPEGSHTNILTVRTWPRWEIGLQTQMWVDDDLLYDFAGRLLEVEISELAQSLQGDGEYQIFTYSQTHWDRRGICQRVDVYHKDDKVYWVIYEPKPERRFVFDEQAYRKAVETALWEFRDLCAWHLISHLDAFRLDLLAAMVEPPRRVQVQDYL